MLMSIWVEPLNFLENPQPESNCAVANFLFSLLLEAFKDSLFKITSWSSFSRLSLSLLVVWFSSTAGSDPELRFRINAKILLQSPNSKLIETRIRFFGFFFFLCLRGKRRRYRCFPPRRIKIRNTLCREMKQHAIKHVLYIRPDKINNRCAIL